MGTVINEAIRVGVIFDGGKATPAWFAWKGRRVAVKEVTLRWRTREGQALFLHMGVTDGSNGFELIFNQQTLAWLLASVEPLGFE